MIDKNFYLIDEKDRNITIVIANNNIYSMSFDIDKYNRQYFSHNNNWMNVELLIKIYRSYQLNHFDFETNGEFNEFINYLKLCDKENKSGWDLGKFNKEVTYDSN